jgi:hypothetical protein
MHVLAVTLRRSKGLLTVVIGLLIGSLAIDPSPLMPVAQSYRALCERFPALALLTFHAPPLPLALPLLLAVPSLLAGGWAGMRGLIATHRFNHRVRRSPMPLPPRLIILGGELGIVDRLTYLAWAEPAACCFGFLRPRVAVTAGLLARVDDEELLAVLSHERHHLRRHDPLRYLVLHALTRAAFMFPVAPSLRQRKEARIELAADRAALAVAPREALAGALLAVLHTTPVPVPGAAGLTATEARIAQLSGRAVMPAIPGRLMVTSVGLALIIAVTTIALATSADLVRMVCVFCTGNP